MNGKLLLDKETMQKLGYRVVDTIVNHLTELPEKSVTNQKSRTELETIFRAGVAIVLIILSALFIFPLVSEYEKT